MTADTDKPMAFGTKAAAQSTNSAPLSASVAAFLQTAQQFAPVTAGRLIFALDATGSRQPTWDQAATVQADMFDAAANAGGLSVQLVYFRGQNECRASRFVVDAGELKRIMAKIQCQAGATQIGKVFAHTLSASRDNKVNALVFVGDALEENLDALMEQAGRLKLLGTRAFMFQEGHNRHVEAQYKAIARLTGGAYARFQPGAGRELAELLRAVAAYATSGLSGLTALQDGNAAARLLIGQLT